MFYLKRLMREVLVEPIHLGPLLRDMIKQKVHREVEGASLGKYGVVISVLELADEDVIPGKIDNDTGSVSVTVCYQALLFRPFKNEVMDAIVHVCNENGFFAKVGPLQIFVSRYNMPDDFKFDSQRGDAFVSREEDEEIEIREQCVVRLRIMGVQVQASDILAIGTIKDDYLGVVEPAPGV